MRHKILPTIFLLILLVFVPSCSPPHTEKSDDYILKSQLVTISKSDFSEELDLKKAAYSYDIKDDPEEYNQMVIHLVKMLVEEVVLLSAAADKKIVITDEELDLAVNEFKKEYPENSFDQILLKNAISYPFWLHRFKKNMTMDRLIEQELRNKVEITPQDMVDFYTRAKAGQNTGATSAMIRIENEKELVKQLRQQKTQEQYDLWMRSLYSQYPVEINEKKLKQFLLDSNENRNTANEN